MIRQHERKDTEAPAIHCPECNETFFVHISTVAELRDIKTALGGEALVRNHALHNFYECINCGNVIVPPYEIDTTSEYLVEYEKRNIEILEKLNARNKARRKID